MLWVLWRHIRWPLVNSNHQKVPDDQQNILFFSDAQREGDVRRQQHVERRRWPMWTWLIFCSNPSLCLQSLSRGMYSCLCVWLWHLMLEVLLGVFRLCPDSDINCYRLELELKPSSIIAGWQWRGEWGRRRWQWWRGGAPREDVHTIMRMCAQS